MRREYFVSVINPNIRLTARRCDVLTLACTGHSEKEIARRLGMRPDSVSEHKRIIRRLLGARTDAQLAIEGVRHGFVRIPERGFAAADSRERERERETRRKVEERTRSPAN